MPRKTEYGLVWPIRSRIKVHQVDYIFSHISQPTFLACLISSLITLKCQRAFYVAENISTERRIIEAKIPINFVSMGSNWSSSSAVIGQCYFLFGGIDANRCYRFIHGKHEKKMESNLWLDRIVWVCALCFFICLHDIIDFSCPPRKRAAHGTRAQARVPQWNWTDLNERSH